MKNKLFKGIVSIVACMSLVFAFMPVYETEAYAGILDSAQSLADKVVKIGQVTGVTEIDADENEIELTWDKLTLAKSYNIYKYDSSDKTFKLAGTSEKNYYEAEKLLAGAVYKFKVSAVNSSGEEGELSEVYITCTQPDEVENIKAKTTKSTITLSWAKVSRATKYQVYQYNSKTCTWKRIKTTEKTSLKISDLKSATTYKFRIRAYRKANDDIYYGDFETITCKTTGSGSSSDGYIGEEKAKSIALNKAGVKEADARYMVVNMDTEDGIKIYEVEFENGEIEHSFEINAKTGRIIEYEKEYVWD